MSSLHFKAQENHGYQDIIGEEYNSLNYLALGKLTLNEGEEYQCSTEGYEYALVVLSGRISVFCEGDSWSNLGGRDNVFEGKATAVYIPCQSTFKVAAESEVDIAVCKAKSEEKYAPFVVNPNDVKVNQRGKHNWNREVHDIIPDTLENKAQRIIVGETFNASGEWSSYPPHKHDEDDLPEEVSLEEIYHYQIEPEQGFGVQMHYTDDGKIEDAFIVKQGDSFAINYGYHPVVAAGGYQLYYLWFLAGPSHRILSPKDEKVHRWLK